AGEAGQVTDPVAVGIGETARVYLVHHRGRPPWLVVLIHLAPLSVVILIIPSRGAESVESSAEASKFLVGFLVFKTSERRAASLAGSIPVRLRHQHRCRGTGLLAGLPSGRCGGRRRHQPAPAAYRQKSRIHSG